MTAGLVRRATRAAVVLSVALPGTGALALLTSTDAGAAGCAAVEVLAARGTGEPQAGSIIMGSLPTDIAQRTGGQVYQVRYAASVDYVNGPNEGASDALARLQAQAAACPRQLFVLAGYSEGAMVMTTLMSRLPANIEPRVVAAVLYGNPYYKSSSPSATGSAKGQADGLVPGLGVPAAFAGRTRDYCNAGDPVCGAGTNVGAHLSYSRYHAEAVAFAVGKVKGAPAPTTTAPAASDPEPPAAGDGDTVVLENAAIVAVPRYVG